MVWWRSWYNPHLSRKAESGLSLCVGLVIVFDFPVDLGGAFLNVVVALQETHFYRDETSHCIVRTWSSSIFTSDICASISRGFWTSVSHMSVNYSLSGWDQTISETQCHTLNGRDSMSETQFQKHNVRVRFSNLVTHLCNSLHLVVQFDSGVQRYSGFVVLSFPFLGCNISFSETWPATHGIYILGHLLRHDNKDVCCSGPAARKQSLCDSLWCLQDCFPGDISVAVWIWELLSGYNSYQDNVDWSA